MTLGARSTGRAPDPPCPDSVSLPWRPVAKFSQKAQCEPWMGQDMPGGLRAKAGGQEGGSAWLAALCAGRGLDGERPAPREAPRLGRGRSWAMGGML